MTVLEFFGSGRVALHGPHDLVAAAGELWSPFASTGAGPIGAHPVLVEDLAVACAEVNRFAVAACPRPAVHAGVVTLGGGALAVPAESGAGKSTLVAALCLLGAGYLSDEALIIDGAGAAHGYPKPLALASESLAVLGLPPDAAGERHGPIDAPEHLVTVQSLREAGRRVAGGPATTAQSSSGQGVPVRWIVLPQRRAGTVGVRLEPAPRRRALQTLLRLGFNHYRAPSDFLVAAAAAVTGAQVWTLEYDDARIAATTMIDVLP